MSYLVALLIAVGVPVGLAVTGMIAGYRRRRREDEAAIAPLPPLDGPARPADAVVRYTGTTVDGWLRAVALPGVYARGACALWLEPSGLVFQRDRGPVVAAAPAVTVSLERAHAGQFVGHDRVLVVRWRHRSRDDAPLTLDSGFVFSSADDARAFAERLQPHAQGSDPIAPAGGLATAGGGA